MTFCLALGCVSSGYAKVAVLCELYKSSKSEGRICMQRYLVGWGRTTSEVADRRFLRAHENIATLAERNKPLFNSKLNYRDQD